MKKRFSFLLTLLALLFAIRIQAQNFVEITKDNSGQTIYLNSTQVLEVMLPITPSNGYIWCLANASDDKLIQQSIEEFGDRDFISDRSIANGKVLVGQSGKQIIRYVGTSQGTTELTLELKRPWEKNGSAIDYYSITIISSGKYSGTYTPQVKKAPKHLTITPSSVPSKWDWRSQCTPIANQMSCGDCWAFASVGTFECNIKIHDGVTRDISEAYLTNCDNDSNFLGCNGGWCPDNYWMAPRGAVYEADCPWTTSLGNGTTGTCSLPYPFHETIDTFVVVPGENPVDSIPPDSNMKKAIYNYGPIWIAMDASSGAFSSYTGGVYTGTGTTTDHAVVLVGWVDSTAISGGGYWILRNSWGTGWGINGYMYISYGSALVGTFANYIVYKGGTLHTIPPVANFGATSTSSCTGAIQFADSSYDSPTSWLWDFGDGTSSILQNPLHIYNANGTYTVKLTATNTYGNNSVTKSSFITINMPAAPTTTGASHTGAGSVTLSAAGSGTLNWYNAATGDTLVNIGTTYITPVLSSTTTYYVENDISYSVQSVGLASSTLSSSTGGYYTSSATQGLIFDAMTPLTIKSVTVYASGTASRTITLKNSSGTVIKTLTTSIASGTQSVTLNFDVPAGTGYVLACGPSCNLWREKSGAVYPYTISNLISITGNTAGSAGYYYYFYNWQVQQQPCTSIRIPVIATINNGSGINENSITGFEIFPNPSSGSFEIKISNQSFQNATVSIMNILGELLIEKKINNCNTMKFDVSNFPPGMYYIKIQMENTISGNQGTYIKKVCLK